MLHKNTIFFFFLAYLALEKSLMINKPSDGLL